LMANSRKRFIGCNYCWLTFFPLIKLISGSCAA
jgi:hypothetical protein